MMIPMEKESCDVGLHKDDKYGWKLKVKGDCKEVLNDISKKLGEYGRRYLEDRLIFEASKKSEIPADENNSEKD